MLLSVHADLHPTTPEARHVVVVAMRYLEEKDPARADLVKRLVKLASHALREAGNW